jgi:hypothetical protein
MLTASGLAPTDARVVLARRASELLEGGRAARLAPERRQGLERLATRLGLRAFDASLVIAIAQDAARTGTHAGSSDVEGRLGLVGAPAERAAFPGRWTVVAAAGLALVMVCAAVQWVTGV